jgi:leucyl aminopeptidase (aminopeptidase T)
VTTDLTGIRFSPGLAQGARNAVRTCLAIRPDERVVLLTDRDSLTVGAALHAELLPVAGAIEPIVLEDVAPRPLAALPESVADAFRRADVSIFACRAYPNELGMRRAMTGIVNTRKMRHAHMVGITEQIMMEGMRADFTEVARLTEWVRSRAVHAKEIVCRTPAGTDLRATFVPEIRWVPTPGIISPEKWGNLPGGETFTSPQRVDGVFVVDGVLGDWLAPKYGDIRQTPLTITIEDSRIVDTRCDNREALEDFRRYTSTDENSNRVGEYALGTNLAVTRLIGNMLQDEKIPGVHIAFGHPYSKHTGAKWVSSTHIDVVGRDFDVWFDGKQIMRKGSYLTNGGL